MRSAFSMNHERGVRHVDADFDHRWSPPKAGFYQSLKRRIVSSFAGVGMQAVDQPEHGGQATRTASAAAVLLPPLE